MSKTTTRKESEKRKQKVDIFLWDRNAGNTKESWTFGFVGVVNISVQMILFWCIPAKKLMVL